MSTLFLSSVQHVLPRRRVRRRRGRGSAQAESTAHLYQILSGLLYIQTNMSLKTTTNMMTNAIT